MGGCFKNQTIGKDLAGDKKVRCINSNSLNMY